jgi:hypothetical protein
MDEPKKEEAAAAASAPAADQAKQPPAQEGDPKEEVKVAKAEPVLLPTVDQAKAELDANPARTRCCRKTATSCAASSEPHNPQGGSDVER